MKTLDGHEDKIWGLHSNKQDDTVVTASSDSCITLWKVRQSLTVVPLWVRNQNSVGELRIPGACSWLLQDGTCSPHFLHSEIGLVRLILGLGVFLALLSFPSGCYTMSFSSPPSAGLVKVLWGEVASLWI